MKIFIAVLILILSFSNLNSKYLLVKVQDDIKVPHHQSYRGLRYKSRYGYIQGTVYVENYTLDQGICVEKN